MFGIFSIIYAIVLIINAVVVLDNKRVLTPLRMPIDKEYRVKMSGIRQRVVELISATRTVFEFPLLFLNAIYILYELFLG